LTDRTVIKYKGYKYGTYEILCNYFQPSVRQRKCICWTAVANKTNMFFADHEIINKATTQLKTLEENLESREEKVLTFWHSFFKFTSQAQGVNMASISPILEFTDDELFTVESDIIKRIANEGPAVIIGRYDFDVLRPYPNHVSIFMHANKEFRTNRIHIAYNLPYAEAERMIGKSDKERAAYCKTFTGKEWTDKLNYDISIDTSKLGIDNTIEFILKSVELIPFIEKK